MTELLVGLVSISDRASAGVYKDGHPGAQGLAQQRHRLPRLRQTRLIADEQPVIEGTLRSCRPPGLILTTGGTARRARRRRGQPSR
jgi:molybdopterin adenylyltransferase